MTFAEINEVCDKIDKCGMYIGERYYRSENDIYERKKYMYFKNYSDKTDTYNEGVMEDPYRANNTLASGWFKILVDQKINYCIGKPFTIEVEEVDRSIRNTIKTIGKEASKKSAGYGYVYVKDGMLKLKSIPPEQLYPVWLDEEYSVMKKAYRKYKIGDTEHFEIITNEGIEAYTKNEGQWVLVGFKYHITLSEVMGTDVTDVKGKGWSQVPIIPLYNNDERISDLHNIKGDIDIYDIVKSDYANNLEDIQDAFAVVKGYNGDNVSELMNNIKQYKVAKVGEGGDFKLETQEIPHVAKTEFLQLTRQQIFIDGMGFDTDTVGEGNATNYVIQMRLSNLKMKCAEFEKQVQDFMFKMLLFVNEFYNKGYVEDDGLIEFNRMQLINEAELLEALTKQKGIISDETLFEAHPLVESVEEEVKRLKAEEEEAIIFNDDMNEVDNNGTNTATETT